MYVSTYMSSWLPIPLLSTPYPWWTSEQIWTYYVDGKRVSAREATPFTHETYLIPISKVSCGDSRYITLNPTPT